LGFEIDFSKLRFRDKYFGFRAPGINWRGFRIYSLGFRAYSLGFKVMEFLFGGKGFGFRAWAFDGRGSPLQFTLSFGEISWCDVQRRTQPCDWLGKSHFCVVPVHIFRLRDFSSQSQRCILRCQGILPNDSVNYSG
jgi:hypothetical protein